MMLDGRLLEVLDMESRGGDDWRRGTSLSGFVFDAMGWDGMDGWMDMAVAVWVEDCEVRGARCAVLTLC